MCQLSVLSAAVVVEVAAAEVGYIVETVVRDLVLA